MSAHDHDQLSLGDVALDSGGVLEDARLAYATFGTLSDARDNVVVMPTYYTGSHRECAQMTGNDRALDPARWFIVVPNLFGNGVSTSPDSYAPGGAAFPLVSIADNVRCQVRLLREELGVERVRLVVGWSMGALQAYEWAAQEEIAVDAIAPICGAARTSALNKAFLDGARAALEADASFAGGHYTRTPRAGLEAFGRVYAGWAYSAEFFRERMFESLGCGSVEALLDRWAEEHVGWDANNLLAMMDTWRSADISARAAFDGNLASALASIRSRAIVMPCRQDRYFAVEDSAFEVQHLANARLEVLESPWGHLAGSPLYDSASKRVIDEALRELLD